MLQITPQMRILVAIEAIDARKGIDSLAQLCREKLAADPFSGCLFIFRSRSGKAIRILTYDGQGFWIATKRLSKGRFKWWPSGNEPAKTLRAHQAQLLFAGGNPRTHSKEQIAGIAASIKEWGWTNPILVGADNDIIAGHARLAAAQKLAMPEVPVIQLAHLSPAQRRALVIADNQLAVLGAGWDEEMLRIELATLQEDDYNLDLVGFGDVELARLLEAQDAADGLTDEDSVPDLPEAPVTVAGDLWILGEHRLFCGDATKQSDVDQAMGDSPADLAFTDPPYNVDYEGYTEERLTIKGDKMSTEQFQAFLLASFRSYRHALKPGASIYVCHSSSWQREFQGAMEAADFEVRCQIIWAKNTFAWGFGRYKFQHEPIFYAHVAGQKDPWYGDKSQSTLWQEKKPAANRLHPTSKPVELVERALINSSKAGDIVADFFGGSGSTLIGCERRGRKARLMEIDPRYADCIVKRWEEYTGKKAVLDGDGRGFSEVSDLVFTHYAP